MSGWVIPAAVLALSFLFFSGASVLKRSAAACPMQDELKSLVSEKAAGIRQWNAFEGIYSFEVGGPPRIIGGYTVRFNQGYVNCVKDDGKAIFKCDRRDPIFTISSGNNPGRVLSAHEVAVGQDDLRLVGDVKCIG